MSNFTDAFMQAYKAFKPSETELERQRQNKGLQELLKQAQGLATKDNNVTSANNLYNSEQAWLADNPANGKSFTLGASANSLYPEPQKTDVLSNMTFPKFSYQQGAENNKGQKLAAEAPSLAELLPRRQPPNSGMPTAPVAAPTYSDADMYKFIQAALKNGVDASQAMPFAQNLYGQKKKDAAAAAVGKALGELIANPKADNKLAYSVGLALKMQGLDVNPKDFAELYKTKAPKNVLINTGARMIPATFRNGKYYGPDGNEITAPIEAEVSANAIANHLTYYQYEKAAQRYKDILADIGTAKTADERTAKLNSYHDELSLIGGVLGKNVDNW
ncbi:MAG: hypothetical protein H6Q74_2174 [Firmicutes bacterium]|nr:hypothetical protein [Bacillota bacterium]